MSLVTDGQTSSGSDNCSVTEAAQHLRVSVSFLNKLRSIGGGPAYSVLGSKRGGRIVYRVRDLDAWQDQRRRTSTADKGGAHAKAS
jgi:hypothetical protein